METMTLEHGETLSVAEGYVLAAQTTAAAGRASRRGDIGEAVRLLEMAKRVRDNARWLEARLPAREVA